MVADLDGFKQLNDRFGHAAGDEALVAFAHVLAGRCARATTRSGSAATSSPSSLAEATEDDAREVVARIETLLEQLSAGGEPWAADLSASFGFASCPEHARDAQTLFRLADEALYEAKRTGTGLASSPRAVTAVARTVRLRSAVQKYVLSELDSGERVISEQVASVRSVALGFWIGAGSRDERADRAGVSHFIEHLLFKGSRRSTRSRSRRRSTRWAPS